MHALDWGWGLGLLPGVSSSCSESGAGGVDLGVGGGQVKNWVMARVWE